MYEEVTIDGWVKTRDNIEVCMDDRGVLLITTDKDSDVIEVSMKSLLKNAHLYLTSEEINTMKVLLCKIVLEV